MPQRSKDRSPAARAYHKLYDTAAWKKRRALHLADQPLCAYCEAAGLTQPADVADHIIPHRGDHDLFYRGELQSLCHQHHNSTKQREEKGGWDSATDLDGYPLDPSHPSNRTRS